MSRQMRILAQRIAVILFSVASLAVVSAAQEVQDVTVTPSTPTASAGATVNIAVTATVPYFGGAITNFELSCTVGTDQYDPVQMELTGNVEKYGANYTLPVEAPRSAGTVTVNCTVTATTGSNRTATGVGSGTFTVVSCTGTIQSTSAPGSGPYTDQYSYTAFTLSIALSGSGTVTPKTDTGRGLTGDSEIKDCDGDANDTDPVPATLTVGDGITEATSVTFNFTYSVYSYMPSDPCSDDCPAGSSDEYNTVDPSDSPASDFITGTCS